MGNAFSNQYAQNYFGFIALIISLVALFTTVLQVLQQYYSSAEGYRRCADSVMGLWAKGTHRKLRFQEFRIEVVFETPVIFTAHPENKRGPIHGREIHYIDGSDDSYKNTRVLGPQAQEKIEAEATARVHTADDERASWVTLLSTLQLKESSSRKWDLDSRKNSPPPRDQKPYKPIPLLFILSQLVCRARLALGISFPPRLRNHMQRLLSVIWWK